jgi:hypothetical protein
VPEKRDDVVILRIALLWLALVWVAALVVVPYFARIFDEFDATLPWQTRILLASYKWWGVAPLAIAVAWYVSKNTPGRSRLACACAFGLGAVLTLFGIWACFSPIIALGSESGI